MKKIAIWKKMDRQLGDGLGLSIREFVAECNREELYVSEKSVGRYRAMFHKMGYRSTYQPDTRSWRYRVGFYLFWSTSVASWRSTIDRRCGRDVKLQDVILKGIEAIEAKQRKRGKPHAAKGK